MPYPGRTVTLEYCLRHQLKVPSAPTWTCPICLEHIDREALCETSCKHIFCKACISTWLTDQDFQCPLCRRALYSGPPCAKNYVADWQLKLDERLDNLLLSKSWREVVTTWIRERMACTDDKSRALFDRAIKCVRGYSVQSQAPAKVEYSHEYPNLIAISKILYHLNYDFLTKEQLSQWVKMTHTLAASLQTDLDGWIGDRSDLEREILATLSPKIAGTVFALVEHAPKAAVQMYNAIGDAGAGPWMLQLMLWHVADMALDAYPGSVEKKPTQEAESDEDVIT